MAERPQGHDIALIRGTVSAPNDAERRYAARVTEWLERWLSEMSLPPRVIDDDKVSRAALRGASVAVLGYNPYPGTVELDVLRDFVHGGGRLLVFYSAEPRLAELLRLRLGEYKSSPSLDRWAAIRFTGFAPPHLPDRVRQETRNIRPVYPADRRAKVIAYWDGAGKTKNPDPALTESDRGFWMTYILRDDGDTGNKKQMLLGLLGACDATLWRPPAERCRTHIDGFRPLTDLGRISALIRRHAVAGEKGAAVARRLDMAASLHANLHTLSQAGRYTDVIETNRRASGLLVQAYGLAQRSRQGEFRAVWDHSGTGLYPGDWDRTCRFLSQHGFTDLIVNFFWGGVAHYDSRVLPKSDIYRTYGDQLVQCVAAGRRHGLRVHAWKVCWNLERAPAPFVSGLRKQGRLIETDTGRTINWLSPSHPANVELELASIREVVSRCGVDGVHLDYIRYPDSHAGYSDQSRARFERWLGRSVSSWPEGARSGETGEAFSRWKRLQIDGLVARVSEESRKLSPRIALSAAVYGKYPSCVDSVSQDWVEWLRKGHMDFVCPMNYTSDVAAFRRLLRDQLSLPHTAGRLVPGIGVSARESRLGPVQVIQQVREARTPGVPGFALFELNRVLETEIVPVLSLGITAKGSAGGR